MYLGLVVRKGWFTLGLSKLLWSFLTLNEHKLKDSFDAVNRIHNISPTLFSEGYRFVSFDVTSLFTNIPLHYYYYYYKFPN
jgi:hypothetical protein